MSLSNPKLQNPATKFIEFKGDKGIFQYFDKANGENVELQMPFYFVVLDELSTITGYNKDNDCGIYSNEIHSLNDEILKVKTFKGGISIVGKYSEIKNDLKAIGGKFTKSIYAMLLGKPNELVHFKFFGAAFSSWLDKRIDLNKCAVFVNETSQGKNGNVVYTFPIFKAFPIPEAKKYILSEAVEMDKQLQKYIVSYKNYQIEKVEAKEETTTNPAETSQFSESGENDEFNMLASVKQAAINNDVSDVDDLPF
jgi:hypothetical protein